MNGSGSETAKIASATSSANMVEMQILRPRPRAHEWEANGGVQPSLLQQASH